jgi:hypothetical protein
MLILLIFTLICNNIFVILRQINFLPAWMLLLLNCCPAAIVTH